MQLSLPMEELQSEPKDWRAEGLPKTDGHRHPAARDEETAR